MTFGQFFMFPDFSLTIFNFQVFQSPWEPCITFGLTRGLAYDEGGHNIRACIPETLCMSVLSVLRDPQRSSEILRDPQRSRARAGHETVYLLIAVVCDMVIVLPAGLYGHAPVTR